MLVRLTMICNGATAATRQGAFPSDEPLEPRSLTLAKAMRGTLRRANRVWTAPSLRARQTAEALALDASVEPLLADQDHGSWAGKSFEDVQAEQPQSIAAWLSDPNAAPHGGESLADVARRSSDLMDRLMAERGHTIAITHASVIRTAILHVSRHTACRLLEDRYRAAQHHRFSQRWPQVGFARLRCNCTQSGKTTSLLRATLGEGTGKEKWHGSGLKSPHAP